MKITIEGRVEKAKKLGSIKSVSEAASLNRVTEEEEEGSSIQVFPV